MNLHTNLDLTPLCYQPRAIVHYAMQIEQLSDIKALVMRLKSDPVTGSKTQSWLRLCRKIKDNSRFITAPFRETKAFEKLYNQRTSVERTFGDLKDNYNLDNIRQKWQGQKSLWIYLVLPLLHQDYQMQPARKKPQK